MAPPSHVALIGLGEVGGILAGDLKDLGVARITAFDPLFADPTSAPSLKAAKLGVEACPSAPAAAQGAGLVICAVTAAQALAAAEATAPGIGQGAYFLDLNSASPGTKAAAGQAIDAANGRYVEAAVMSSVPGKGLKTPMLLGGVHAQAFLDDARALQMNASVFSETVGLASATKMCRSVMIKGTEALLAECLLTARHYGVEDTVLGSLSDMLPNPDWERTARYMISRSLAHGKRRAEEMREVARTVSEAGGEPLMSSAIAQRQDWAHARAQQLPAGTADGEDLDEMLDAVRRVMRGG